MSPLAGGGWDTGKVPLLLCPDPAAHVAGVERAFENVERWRTALAEIYDDARYLFDGNHGTPESAFRAGECRWCGSPPPDGIHDHDMACPAAKAGYALRLPGYQTWAEAAEAINDVLLAVNRARADLETESDEDGGGMDAAERIGEA